jgi:hypothetical protein
MAKTNGINQDQNLKKKMELMIKDEALILQQPQNFLT